MKVREVININRTLTLQELYEFMQQCWDKTTYNDFVLGRPAVGAFRDYILLPATKRYVISKEVFCLLDLMKCSTMFKTEMCKIWKNTTHELMAIT